jgi:hypothetical protein
MEGTWKAIAKPSVSEPPEGGLVRLMIYQTQLSWQMLCIKANRHTVTFVVLEEPQQKTRSDLVKWAATAPPPSPLPTCT